MIKKLSISIAALALAFTPAIADEGMWLLPLLKKMNIGTMQEMGLELSAEDIYSINNTSLKDAIVQFGGGCTGEIISPNGLLVTLLTHFQGLSVNLSSSRATLTSSGGTLSVALYMYVSERGEMEVGFAIAAILMILALVLNLSAKLAGKKLKR